MDYGRIPGFIFFVLGEQAWFFAIPAAGFLKPLLLRTKPNMEISQFGVSAAALGRMAGIGLIYLFPLNVAVTGANDGGVVVVLLLLRRGQYLWSGAILIYPWLPWLPWWTSGWSGDLGASE